MSPAAEHFLRVRVGTLLHLDALLIVWSEPARWWSAENMAVELRVSTDSAGRVLEDLAAANLLDVKILASVAYRFAPLDDEVPALLKEIAAVHFEDRPGIEAVLHQRPRRGAAHRFADAFRIKDRKNRKDHG